MIYALSYKRDPRHMPPGITYRDPVQTTTWCVPSGWSDQCIKNDFERQFPGAVVVSLRAKGEEEMV